MLRNVVPQLAIFGRVCLAALFGFIIGLERESRGKSAGERTFALVAIAAACFGSFAAYVFPLTGGQVLSGVATGIGFLGIGIIWRSEMGPAHGLTTAASIWTTAAVGLMAGLGLYIAGAFVSVLVLLVLEFDRIPVLRGLHDRAASKGAGDGDRREGDDGDGDGDDTAPPTAEVEPQDPRGSPLG